MGKRMKKERKDRHKCVVYEHPSAAARSPFPNGEGCDTRMPLLALSERIHAYVEKNNDGQSLPRVGNAVKLR